MNDLDTPTQERPLKRFKTAQAKLAMLGWRLFRSHPEDDDFFIALGLCNQTLTFRTLEHVMQHLCNEQPCLANSGA